ncbi:MAG: hypothetical protein ACI9YT_001254 [Halobacteriales archaeon]|jgi:hypothetical protein
MASRWLRSFGGASILGGILTVLVSVPTSWYGLEPRDSYVFDPPPLSPLWINREVIPVLSVVAAIGLLLGVAGLVRRDWSVAGRARRWGGVSVVVAFVGVTIAVPALLYSSRDPVGGVVLTLAGLGVGALSLLILVPSAILLAYGYLKTDRPRVGYAFVGLLVGVPVLGYVVPEPTKATVAALPIAVAWGVLGVELLQHPDPLSGADDGTEG